MTVDKYIELSRSCPLDFDSVTLRIMSQVSLYRETWCLLLMLTLCSGGDSDNG